MQPPHDALSENDRLQLANLHLAAGINGDGQSEQTHWNVGGPTFIPLRDLFDKGAETAEGYTDPNAERAAALVAIAEGTVQLVAQRSFLVAYAASTLAVYGQSVREAIGRVAGVGDADAADLFTEVSRGVHRQIWLVGVTSCGSEGV